MALSDATPLRILFATPELAPWVKTGGLGDVSAALPAALAEAGLEVRVLVPGYPALLAAFSFTTTNFSSFTEIKFRFHFGLDVAIRATIFAIAMGTLGGLFPAARAARLQIAEAAKG